MSGFQCFVEHRPRPAARDAARSDPASVARSACTESVYVEFDAQRVVAIGTRTFAGTLLNAGVFDLGSRWRGTRAFASG